MADGGRYRPAVDTVSWRLQSLWTRDRKGLNGKADLSLKEAVVGEGGQSVTGGREAGPGPGHCSKVLVAGAVLKWTAVASYPPILAGHTLGLLPLQSRQHQPLV